MKSRKSSCVPDSPRYIGRFAPSPSGPLHFGSLLAAVASFLDARAHQGRWLLRMEDLDPAREPSGTDQTILQQLIDFGLDWDGEVLYQSSRLSAYTAVLDSLKARDLCYACDCSRQRIKELGSVYDGHCRSRGSPPTADFALRLKSDRRIVTFDDLIQGPQSQQLDRDTGDFVVRRRDGLIPYQLAVVVDDAFQAITHVVRGWDLLDSTPRQIYLQQLLEYATPQYAHIPIVTNQLGQKLSKQHFAEAIQPSRRRSLIHDALTVLGLNPRPGNRGESVGAQLESAIAHWRIQDVPKLANIPEPPLLPG